MPDYESEDKIHVSKFPKDCFLNFIEDFRLANQEQTGQPLMSKASAKSQVMEAYNKSGAKGDTVDFENWKNIACEWSGFSQGTTENHLNII